MIRSVWNVTLRLVPALVVDAALVLVAYGLAFLLRFEGSVPEEYLVGFREVAPVALLVYLAVNYLFGVYDRMWSYASSSEVMNIWVAVMVATGLLTGLDVLAGSQRPVPLSVVVLGGVFVLGFFTLLRYRWRLVTGFLLRWRASRGARKRVLIVGAGEAGQLLAWQLKNLAHTYDVVGFIDDDPRKKGMRVHGARVLGDRSSIPSAAAMKAVDTIVIAIHRLSGSDFRDILARCQETHAQVKVLPNVLGMMDNNVGEPLLRDIGVEDLLGRKAVPVDQEMCHRLLRGKVVLVTGAAGSIGSELCRQIVQFSPSRLLLLDNNESGLHDLTLQLQRQANGTDILHPVVADILRREKLERLFSRWRPQVIFHCAAYKHVPLMEEHPDEAVLVNVIGTRNVCELASEAGAERFVLISTDKAVTPVSVMGMTKRLCEMMVLAMPRDATCRFTAVRFGNVLNSRGSVIPTFLRQIETGGPVTVTDARMTRFFMGPLEAVNLILQAATLTGGGDIFVLDMGEEIRIVDLAQRLIRLRGLRVGEDIEIAYSGVRPGEKLEERLYDPALEERAPTTHPYIFRVRQSQAAPQKDLWAKVDSLAGLAHRVGDGPGPAALLTALQESVGALREKTAS
ncbi:MAG: polysaccharide biosynthesis protein [Chloroflexi bacterium]|nr:polysaccharide biosynthesis protein [Chloroflexota bacterium]